MPHQEETLLGQQVQTTRGVIRNIPDYDDAWFYELSKSSETIFDIGASIGFTGLLSAMCPTTKKILLVDPNPLALSIAAKNLIMNNLAHKCLFYSGFIGDKDGGQVKFYTVGAGAAGSIFKGHAKTAFSSNSFFMVNTTTLDKLSGQFELIPDLVKIDVEGAESLVLAGAIKMAEKKQTRFMIEMHSPPELTMKENGERIIKWCRGVSYAAWYMKEAEQLLDAHQIAHRGKCHLLLQPSEWPYPESLKQIKQGAFLPTTV